MSVSKNFRGLREFFFFEIFFASDFDEFLTEQTRLKMCKIHAIKSKIGPCIVGQ